MLDISFINILMSLSHHRGKQVWISMFIDILAVILNHDYNSTCNFICWFQLFYFSTFSITLVRESFSSCRCHIWIISVSWNISGKLALLRRQIQLSNIKVKLWLFKLGFCLSILTLPCTNFWLKDCFFILTLRFWIKKKPVYCLTQFVVLYSYVLVWIFVIVLKTTHNFFFERTT